MKLLLLASLALTSAAFAGSLDRPNSGTQAAQGGLAAPAPSFTLKGYVVQKLESGLLVDTGSPGARKTASGAKGIVFLEGDFPKLFAEAKVTMLVKDAGTYSYASVGGSSEIIRKVVPAR